ncbi:hypothetical protein PoB_001045500 [Plakobranchus ocellatus]|uniref:Uncharacterized protein n=1 Tax=Plakobranchus ocellatus TaxID=259542 RepID=A0AAV3YNA0_9GAST|nr:hypothetical protein PoB_001045500 [Plakobranchus ocellatus]
MAFPFPLSDRASDVRPGCKTQMIAPTFRQVADLMCARIKEREYFKTCIVGHVNCCLQWGPTLSVGPHWRRRDLYKATRRTDVAVIVLYPTRS